jgi:hypothetical protein
MNETLIVLNVVLMAINVCAAVASVTFAIQASIAMRRIERQSRELRYYN